MTSTEPRIRVAGIFIDGSYKMINLTRGLLIVPMNMNVRE
jgi:hypothetical protein